MKTHRLTPYTSSLVVLVVQDPIKDVARLRRKYGDVDIEFKDRSAATTYDRTCVLASGGNSHYLFVLLSATKGTDVDTICHEATHVVNFCFNYHGVKLDSESDEHQAYLMGYVANIISQEVLKQFKPKKKSR